MSSVLQRLRSAKMDPSARPPKRVTVLEATETAPEFVVMTKFLPQAEYTRIIQPFRRRNANPIEGLMIGLLPPGDQEKAKQRVMKKVVDSWSGCVKENLLRFSEKAFLNPEILAELPDDEEIPCTDESIEDIASLMNNEHFFTIQNVALQQDEWLRDEDETPEAAKKNGAVSTSDS